MATSLDSVIELLQRQEFDAALQRCKSICAQDPGLPDAWQLLGAINGQMGRLRDAVDAFQQAVNRRPNWPEATLNLARARILSGDAQSGLREIRDLLKVHSHDALVHTNCGAELIRIGLIEEALPVCRRATALAPGSGVAHANLGLCLGMKGLATEALHHARAAYRLGPQSPDVRNIFFQALLATDLNTTPHEIIVDAEQALCDSGGDLETVFPLVMAVLRRCLESAGLRYDTGPHLFAPRSDVTNILPLVGTAFGGGSILTLLRQVVVADEWIEALLTNTRHEFLRLVTGSHDSIIQCPDSVIHDLACSLACQCFNNDYAYFCSNDEYSCLDQLSAEIENEVSSTQEISHLLYVKIATLAMYRPLKTLKTAQRLEQLSLATSPSDAFYELVERQIRQPREEMNLAESIPSLAPIQRSVSVAVRAQYEESPYPKWVSTTRNEPRPIQEVMVALSDRFAPSPLLDGQIDILIAGGGTGRHPIGIATRFSNASVLSVDLSRASLAYAARCARKLGIGSLTFLHADLLDLGRLEKRFHVIVASGVLHHLADPVEGWRLLRDLLLPGGVMNIGLYSRLARRPVARARELIERNSFSTAPDGIRAARRMLLQLTPGDLAREVVRFADFFNLSNCRDLLFHVQETDYTLNEISSILESLDLSFLGFEFSHPGILAHFSRLHTSRSAQSDLSVWNNYEAEHERRFSGMYQFWCQATDRVGTIPPKNS